MSMCNRSTLSNTHYLPSGYLSFDHDILREHEGCTRCRVFYAGHTYTTCSNVPPTRQDYVERTLQDALCTKARVHTSTPRAPPIAAIIEAASSPPPFAELVAAILPTHTASPDSPLDLSDEPSLSSMSHPTTFKRDHFFWNCTLNTKSDHQLITIRALLNSGAHMTLIRPDIISRAHLHAIPLPQHESIELAVDSKSEKTITISLTHYVLLTPRSIDSIFTSHTIPAIITPKLSVPLILGMTFLYTN